MLLNWFISSPTCAAGSNTSVSRGLSRSRRLFCTMYGRVSTGADPIFLYTVKSSQTTSTHQREIMLRDAPSDSQHTTFQSSSRRACPNSSLAVNEVNYCNSVLNDIPSHLMDRLQSMLNAAARLAFSARRFDHITSLLRELQWLSDLERI